MFKCLVEINISDNFFLSMLPPDFFNFRDNLQKTVNTATMISIRGSFISYVRLAEVCFGIAQELTTISII